MNNNKLTSAFPSNVSLSISHIKQTLFLSSVILSQLQRTKLKRSHVHILYILYVCSKNHIYMYICEFSHTFSLLISENLSTSTATTRLRPIMVTNIRNNRSKKILSKYTEYKTSSPSEGRSGISYTQGKIRAGVYILQLNYLQSNK